MTMPEGKKKKAVSKPKDFIKENIGQFKQKIMAMTDKTKNFEREEAKSS